MRVRRIRNAGDWKLEILAKLERGGIHVFKKIWQNWRYQRMLQNYYWSRSEKPRGENFFLYLIGTFFAILFVFRHAGTFREALLSLAFLLILLVMCIRAVNSRRYLRIKQCCHQALLEKEFLKRLDSTLLSEILYCLKEELARKFPIEGLAVSEGYLAGHYQGQKLAVFYKHVTEEDMLEAKEVEPILKHCLANHIYQVRIYTNKEFSPRILTLRERYPGVSFKVFNGYALRIVLKDNYLLPTEEEIKSIIEKEITLQRKKLDIIRKQAFKSEKYVSYLIYSVVLLCLAWLKVGVYYLNLFFGLLLLVLAVFSIINSIKKEEEEIVF